MRKNRLIMMVTALALVLALVLSGCKSEKKDAAPVTPSASGTLPASVKPAPQSSAASSAAAVQVTVKPTLPAAATSSAAPSAAPGKLEKTLQDLMNKSQKISSMKYDMVMSGGLMTSKSYKKNNKFRMETNTMGMIMTIITDKDKQVTYTWMVDKNQATMTDLTKQTPLTSQASVQDFWSYSDLVSKGTETIDGKACTVVEFSTTTDNGKINGKVWIWQEYGVPLKMDSTVVGTTEKELTMTLTAEFKNYEFVDLPDSLFVLPSTVEIVDKLDFFPAGMPSGLPSGIPSNLPTKFPTKTPN